jgi:hypothetical protein
MTKNDYGTVLQGGCAEPRKERKKKKKPTKTRKKYPHH